MTTYGLYLRDLSHRRTQSHGIVNYGLGLTAAVAAQLAGPERLVVFANDEVAPALRLPAGDAVEVVVDGPPVRGVQRVASDHAGSLRAARRHGVRVLHFPKGFIPLLNPTRIALAATVHDDIPLRYWEGRWGREYRTAANGYFSWLLSHAVRRADTLLTVSAFTGGQLAQRWPSARAVVTGQGVTLPSHAFIPLARRGRYALHFGSVLPHKGSAAALRLLLQWLDDNPGHGVEQVRLVGDVGEVPGVSDHPRLKQVEGPQDNAAIAGLLASARFLLFGSRYEGFGLPPLEAAILGTPAVHARIPAVAEVLGDAPGGYDANDPHSFDAGVRTVLRLDDESLRSAAAAAARRHRWDAAGAETLRVYRSLAVSQS